MKVKHYRQVPGTAAKRPEDPGLARFLLLPLMVAVPGLVLAALYALLNEVANPPNIDLSRRAAFASASLLSLWAAGMVGFALGTRGARDLPTTQVEATARDIARSRRSKILLISGIALLVASGWLEYLAAFDLMP